MSLLYHDLKMIEKMHLRFNSQRLKDIKEKSKFTLETKTESDAKWTRLFEIPTIFFNTSEERAIQFYFNVIFFISQGID